MRDTMKRYSTPLFSDIFPDVNEFLTKLANCDIDVPIKYESKTLTYYLLVARHGNDPIASEDVNQFMYKIFGAMFQFAPTWEKRLDVQKKLRGMSENELMKGARTIRNHAYNPSTEPTTAYDEVLPTTDDQSSAIYKRSKLEAYSTLLELLDMDVTEEYLYHFDKMFYKVVAPAFPVLFPQEEGEEEDE